MRCAVLLVLALLVALPAAAQGRWQSFLAPGGFTDIEADTASLWLASAEGGLARYDRASGTFEFTHRAPGQLASNQLTALALDATGRLWAGTLGSGASLRSADGRSWRLVSRLDLLPSDSVTAVAADGLNAWIATRGGLAFWNGSGEGSVDAYWPNDDEAPFQDDYVRDVVVVGTTVWAATRAGVYRNSTVQTGAWTLVSAGLGVGDVTGLASDGTTVFALANGTVYRGGETGTWTDTNIPFGAAALNGKSGQVFAGTSLYVERWNGSGWERLFHRQPPGVYPGPVNGIALADPDGRYWAVNFAGLWRNIPDVVPTDQYWELRLPNTPVGNNVLNVLRDGDRIYATTLGQGVSRFDGLSWKNWPTACGSCPPDTAFLSPFFCFGGLVDRQGMKWLGCWSSAVERFDDGVDPPVFTRYWATAQAESIKHTWSWAAALDSMGRVWIGGDTPSLGFIDAVGLDRYDSLGVFAQNWQTSVPSNSALRGNQIRALTVDNTGLIWIGYAGLGVESFSPFTGPVAGNTFNLIDQFQQFRDIFALHVEGTVLWVLTTATVERWSTTSRQRISQLLLEAGPVSVGAVHPLDVDRRGYAWVGTQAGLLKIRPDGTIEANGVYTVSSSPIAGDEVRSVVVDRSRDAVWVATSAGLSRFEPHYVPPPPPRLASLSVKIYPNPARLTGLGVRLIIEGDAAAYRGAVYDLGGRKVRSFQAAQGGVFWDGLDAAGDRVGPGLYFIHAEGGGQEATARVVLLR